MQSDRKPGPDTIHGVDVASLYENGGEVIIFEQASEVHRTPSHKYGFCAAFNTSVMQKLLEPGHEEQIKSYTTTTPLPERILRDILEQANRMIEFCRDGININFASFLPFYDSSEIKPQRTSSGDLPEALRKVQAATITYKLKNGMLHQLLFYRYDSERCYVSDANRFIAVRAPVTAGIAVLQEIVERSSPEVVELTSVPIKLFPIALNGEPGAPAQESETPAVSAIPSAIEHANAQDSSGSADSLRESMLASASRSFSHAFVSSIIKSFVTDYLTAKKYEPHQVSIIHESIHSLTKMAAGKSSNTAALLAAINNLLVHYAGVSEDTAAGVTAGIMFIATATALINNPRGIKHNAVILAAGVGAGALGDNIGRYSYGLVKTLFSPGSPAEASPNRDVAEQYTNQQLTHADESSDTDNDESSDNNEIEMFGRNANSLML